MSLVSLKESLMMSPEERASLGEFVEQVKDISEFFEEAIKIAKDLPYKDVLERRKLPWLAGAGSALPLIKFAAVLLESSSNRETRR